VSGNNDGASEFVEHSKFEWAPEDIVILPPGDEDEDDESKEEPEE